MLIDDPTTLLIVVGGVPVVLSGYIDINHEIWFLRSWINHQVK